MAGQGPAQCARPLEDPQVGPGRVAGLPRGSLPHLVVGASEDRPRPLDPFPQESVSDPFAAGDVPCSGPVGPRLGAGGVPGCLAQEGDELRPRAAERREHCSDKGVAPVAVRARNVYITYTFAYDRFAYLKFVLVIFAL